MSTPESPTTVLRYRRDIDGLRAVAVLPVLFFHAHLSFTGGYVGVDVFFVISGYLITGLLRKVVEGGSFSLPDFWHRRIRRLWPALSALVLTVLAVGIVVLFPRDLVLLAESTASQAVLSANFYFWSQAGYFGPDVESMQLLHTWSLAVEEQFYLLYPLPFAWFLSRSLKTTRVLFVITLVGSLGLSAYLTPIEPSFSFYLLPTRAWELTLGALLALGAVPEIRSRITREVMSLAGTAAILYAVFAYDSTTPFPGIAAAAPCFGAAAIMHANTDEQTIIGRVLSWGPMVFVGLLSYSLYLWHWPALVYLRYLSDEEPSVTARLIALGVSFVIAWISWRFIETPFRKKQLLKDRRSIFIMAGVLSAIPLAASIYIIKADGLPDRFSAEVLALAQPEEDEEDPVDEDEEEAKPRAPGDDFTRGWREMKWGDFDMTLEDVQAGRLLILGDENAGGADQRPHFLLWGDSHARPMLGILDDMAKKHGVVGLAATHSATVPLLGTWRPNKPFPAVAYNRAVVEFIREHKPRNVILAARWAVVVEGRPDGKLDSLIRDAEDADLTVEAAKGAFKRGLDRTLEDLRALDVEIWILEQVPLQKGNVKRMMARAVKSGEDPDSVGVTREEHEKRQAFITETLEAVEGGRVHLIDPADVLFDDKGRSVVRAGDTAAYRDFHHLSKPGARLLEPILEPIFKQ